MATVAIHAEDDADSLHVSAADSKVRLNGTGVQAYLDIDQIIGAAVRTGCDALHPGYGFLSENAALAKRCGASGITFVGPPVPLLELFGDKVRSRRMAVDAGVPVIRGSEGRVDVNAAHEFFRSLQGDAMVVKAVAGGGGRGIRVVKHEDEVDEALRRCASEALAAFGSGDLYLEALIERALHIEVQILGDGHSVTHLGERDCSVQRRHQKLVEIAPSPRLTNRLRQRIHEAALTFAAATRYENIGTFEFLVDATRLGDDAPFYFIEANPRLQVEHTVTEQVTGVDLVAIQIALASGARLEELRIPASPPQGHAIELRINAERYDSQLGPVPTTGVVNTFAPPGGPGVRVDTACSGGYRVNLHFDSLLAKLIVHSPHDGFDHVVARTQRALAQFRIDGVETNRAALAQLLALEEFRSGAIDTAYFDRHVSSSPSVAAAPTYDERAADTDRQVLSPLQANVVMISARQGESVARDQELIVLNAMKMEHVIGAPVAGIVREIRCAIGETVRDGSVLVVIEPIGDAEEVQRPDAQIDVDAGRPDLDELNRRRALTTDESRSAQTAKRHAAGSRTARENVRDLCDEGTFVQFGRLAVGSNLKGTVDELLDYAPGDGLVMGLGAVNGEHFEQSRVAVVAYDYSVLAGTQGVMNHKLLDRMFHVAERLSLPVVLFTEGGGGRAGGGSRANNAPRSGLIGGGGLKTSSWNLLAKLSGRVPLVGINSGFCFAGNAALLGCCDVIIATRNSSIGMGGPAMIEGGGLGTYAPEEVGPMSVQVPNGVVDIAVADEAEAVAAAKRYLSYFQGSFPRWTCPDQRLLRHAIPENRLRVYDIRNLLRTLADHDSVLELRPEFGRAVLTALIRIEGRPLGVIASNPAFLSGAIDSDAADKSARFMTLCDAFDLPLLVLCDTPGIMVGPDAESSATVRHASRLFLVGASLTVPTFAVIVRKAYGLGAQALVGGSHDTPAFIVAWPTSEFGGMGLEGQVRLGYRAKLDAIADPTDRQHEFDRLVELHYSVGKGLNAAHVFEVDDVIDPADTRRWIVAGLSSMPPAIGRSRKRPCVDAW